MSCAASNSNLPNELNEGNKTNPLIIENNLQYNTHNYETFVGVRALGKKCPRIINHGANSMHKKFGADENEKDTRKRHLA